MISDTEAQALAPRLLQYEIDTPLHKLVATHGRGPAERAYLLGIEAISELEALAGPDCGFARRTSLLLARRKTDIPGLKREFQARRAARLPVRWIDNIGLRSEYGIARPAAIHSNVAAECAPYRLTHNLL